MLAAITHLLAYCVHWGSVINYEYFYFEIEGKLHLLIAMHKCAKFAFLGDIIALDHFAYYVIGQLIHHTDISARH